MLKNLSSINKDNFNDAELARQCQVDLRGNETVITTEQKLPPTQHLKIRVRF